MWPILTHQRQELHDLSPEKTVLLRLVTSPKMRKILTRMIPENDNYKNSPATYHLVGRIYGEPNNYGSPYLICNKEIGESLFSLPSCRRSRAFQSLTSD